MTVAFQSLELHDEQRHRWEAQARIVGQIPARKFFNVLKSVHGETRRSLLRQRYRYRVDEFCRHFWPERFDLPFSDLHFDLFKRSDIGHWRDRRKEHRTTRDAVAAPRGYAKSTISSFAEIVHAVVYDLEAYVVMLSAGQRLAFGLSKDLRNVFKGPKKGDTASPLSLVYGPFDVEGEVQEWTVSVAGRPSVGFFAASFGGEVRGSKHPTRGIRPTRVVIDDGEKRDRVRNPEQRIIWWDFLSKDVLKLGAREGGCAYFVRGTILHTDSMLARLMTDPGWSSVKYKAILSWPEDLELWERCGQIWKDLTLGDARQRAARAFYMANREAMDEGVEVLDPGAEGIFELYVQIWAEGLAAFLQEKQNDPVDPTAQIFSPEKFTRFRLEVDPVDGPVAVRLKADGSDGRRVRIADMRRFARWDPATGSPHGDYAAIAVIGRDKWGYGYVLDVWIKKAKPSLQLAAAWSLAERWGLGRMSLESNGFQDLVAEPFQRQKAERRAANQFWKLVIDEEPSSDNKEGRIATMEPDVSNGWLAFRVGLPVEVDQQLGEFPTSAHDDAPDVIHGAYRLSGGSPVSMGQTPI